ncbi:DUF1015 domain-containing protein [Thermomonospora catenispora]|uniref:DUF1015 domain-containing protein n=1 Tax=Thermomonospora catenispora TaxID=2493090 RepID=UPI00111D6AD6|nr:DUF1015 domain-containing protein [Thermomonospora catenispora]TNY35409.1 DUF1015 domain-containing protein [Thermomonospora catenispora]
MPAVDPYLPFGAALDGSSSEAGGLELAPFRGVRFAPEAVGDLAAVTCPPYDLIDPEEVRRLTAGDGRNVARLTLPTGEDGYRRAAETLHRWLAEGVLVADPEPALYVYETVAADGALLRGVLGAVGLRPESARVVLPHEEVFPGPVRDRLALMTATGANLEPIFLIYEGPAGVPAGDGAAPGADPGAVVDRIAETRRPVTEFRADDGTFHRLWRVDDPATQERITTGLRDRRAMIADGHHRYATYQALQERRHAAGDGPGPWDYGLALLVDWRRHPPRLGAIHRVLPGLDPREAAERAAKAFTVRETPDLKAGTAALAEADGPAFLLGGADGLWLLTAPDADLLDQAMPAERSPQWRRLDTAVLDTLLIDRLWEVNADERTVEVVHEDPVAALRRARRRGGTAVIMNPPTVADVLAVAAAGERVPRKSTSFGPKPRTGLVMRLLDLG